MNGIPSGLLVALFVLGTTVIFAALASNFLRSRIQPNQSSKSAQMATFRRRPLLSRGELAFYTELYKAVDPHFRIFTKVRLWDIIEVDKFESPGARRGAENKIKSKHVDFAICSPADGVVRLIIELDDKTHSRLDRQQRDAQVDSFLKEAGIAIIRLRAASDYKADEIRSKVFTAIRASIESN